MDFEFDKEIDLLLRQTAQGETASAMKNPESRIPNLESFHLDADEISAFAENALPEKTKQMYLLHLADCDNCRKSLSNLIALNAEQPEETVRVAESRFVQTPVPWYRKLFAVPNLVYAMGALVLVFTGIGVWTVLQNNSQNAEVSHTYEKQTGGRGMSSDGDAATSESYSANSNAASNATAANTAAMNSNSMLSSSNSTTNAAAMPAAPYSAANSNAAISPAERDKDLQDGSKPLAKEPSELAKTQTSDAPAAAAPPLSQLPLNGRQYSPLEEEAAKQSQAQSSIAQNQADIAPDSRNVKRAPAPSARLEIRSKKDDAEDDAAEKKRTTATTTTAGGKTFRREENVWYDSAYRGQPTVNVTRGTQEYKKLDSGLRGIAENLGGTIVVVWKQRAYRIQ